MTNHFETQRQIALIFTLAASCLGWYSLILLTNPKGGYTPDTKQWVGLATAIVVGLAVWVWKCLTIRPHVS